MKKIVLALAVVFSVAMVSCGNKAEKAADSDSVIAVEEVAEEVVVDSAAPVADSAAAVVDSAASVEAAK
ncbi:MAG: hypothetical protein K2O24_08840 [Muribaculaceae bacterium]|nr:hypothetical protein [Muribaculaceae bacterium]